MRNCNISKSRYSEYFGPYLTVKGVLKLVCIKEPKEQEITYQVTHTHHMYRDTPIMGWRMFSMHLISCW